LISSSKSKPKGHQSIPIIRAGAAVTIKATWFGGSWENTVQLFENGAVLEFDLILKMRDCDCEKSNWA
jgi:Na+/H+-translocating membrane pyrophosphatase